MRFATLTFAALLALMTGCTTTPSHPKASGCACSGCTATHCECGTAACCPPTQEHTGATCQHCSGCIAAAEQASPSTTSAPDTPQPTETVATIEAKGMSCPLCASNADRSLKRLDGVESVRIDLGSGQIKVGLTDGGPRPTEAELLGAVRDAGFTPQSVTLPTASDQEQP